MNTLSLTTPTILCGRKKYRKFGKKMNQKTKKDVSKITETLKKLSDDEIKRVQDIYLEHKKFMSPKKEEEKMDFYDV